MTLKQVFKSEAFQNLITTLISWYLKFVYSTSRWTLVDFEGKNSYFEEGKTIFCFWHGRMALTPFIPPKKRTRIVALISAHSDGMLVAKVFQKLNIDYVSGSTNKGGAKALIQLIKVIDNNECVAIIPDGPRGPSRVLAPGIIHLAMHSGARILPIVFATSRFIEFNSWDKFRLPLPFSKGVLVYGDPMSIEKQKDPHILEMWRQKLEQSITALQDKADQLVENRKRA